MLPIHASISVGTAFSDVIRRLMRTGRAVVTVQRQELPVSQAEYQGQRQEHHLARLPDREPDRNGDCAELGKQELRGKHGDGKANKGQHLEQSVPRGIDGPTQQMGQALEGNRGTLWKLRAKLTAETLPTESVVATDVKNRKVIGSTGWLAIFGNMSRTNSRNDAVRNALPKPIRNRL